MTKCLDIIYSTSNTYVYFRNIGPNFLGIGEKESKQLGNDKFFWTDLGQVDNGILTWLYNKVWYQV